MLDSILKKAAAKMADMQSDSLQREVEYAVATPVAVSYKHHVTSLVFFMCTYCASIFFWALVQAPPATWQNSRHVVALWVVAIAVVAAAGAKNDMKQQIINSSDEFLQSVAASFLLAGTLGVIYYAVAIVARALNINAQLTSLPAAIKQMAVGAGTADQPSDDL